MSIVHFVKTESIRAGVNKLFESEKQRIARSLPDAEIEHIGATAVPGTITKGDLDINIRVSVAAFQNTVDVLKGMYEINQPENWTGEFASFKDELRDIGVQVTVKNSPEDYYVPLREYLREHPETVARLNELKLRFEDQDMDEYRGAKGEFFQKLITDFIYLK